jgi:hypothetical protein
LISIDPESRRNRAVIEELAASYTALDRPDRVAALWAERARNTPEDLDAALDAAIAFETAGRRSEAETWIEIATLAAPEDPRIEAARLRIARLRSASANDSN